MRVAFLSSNVYPLLSGQAWDEHPIVGGAEIQQLLIARELARLGCEVSFVTEDFGQGEETEASGFRVLGYTFSRNKIVQMRTLWRALELAESDLLYMRGVPRFIGMLAFNGWWCRRPYVIGMSTNRMVFPRPWNGLAPIEDRIYRWSLLSAAGIVVQTEFQRERLARNYSVAGTALIPNGSVASTAQPAPHEERTSVAWIASLHPYKGITRLFELAALCPDIDFDVVGAPERRSEAYYDEMKTRAEVFGNVRWRGPIPNSAVDGILARSLALVHTTLPLPGIPNLEGFPNVYLEAWRNGVPVLTLDNDPDDVIRRHGLGWRVESIPEMGRALRRLRADEEAWGRISGASLRYVGREHSISRVGAAYLDLFRRLVDDPDTRDRKRSGRR